MPLPDSPIALADWRRATSELYAQVRAGANGEENRTWQNWRRQRDILFRTHKQSPLSIEKRSLFSSLAYFKYDPAWRIIAEIDTAVRPKTYFVHLESDGEFRFSRVGQAHFEKDGRGFQISLFWIEGYGGGLFVPFKDQTNGEESFGGGRYLIDTMKGADLGFEGDQIVLDFNYCYNPSCAYDTKWICPLAPAENNLMLPVRAGERAFK